MSGAIRQRLGPRRTALQNILSNPVSIAGIVDSNASDADNIRRLNDKWLELANENVKLSSHIVEIEALHDKWWDVIEKIQDPTEKTAEEQRMTTFGDFIDICLKARDLIADHDTETLQIQQHLDSYRASRRPIPPQAIVPAPAGNVVAESRLKLPTFQLPTFSGDPLLWRNFWDIYESSVHKQNLPPVEKFTYLHSVVKGSAADAIKGIAITNDNYDLAVATLQSLYGNDQIIKQGLYSKLKSLPFAGDGIGKVRATHDALQAILRQLESLNENVEQGSILHDVQSKFGFSILMEINRSRTQAIPWTVKLFLEAIANYIRLQEEIQRMSRFGIADRHDSKPPKPNGSTNGAKRVEGSVDTFVVGTKRSAGKDSRTPKRNCIFCEGGHWDKDCSKFPNSEKRRQKLMDLSLCFKCLGKGHACLSCTRQVSCWFCKKQHQSSLCKDTYGKSQPATTDSPRTKPSTQRQKTDKPACAVVETSTPPATVSSGVKDPANVLAGIIHSPLTKGMLMTATIVIRSEEGVEMKVNAFMDTGSDRTFIREDVSKKLNLFPLREEELNVNTFANNQSRSLSSKVVQFELLLEEGDTLPIEANTVEQIGVSIRKEPLIEKDLKFLKAFRPGGFADENISRTVIQAWVPDILVGQDYFWKLVTNEPRIELPSGLFLVPSEFGLILAGKNAGCIDRNSVSTGSYAVQVIPPMDQRYDELNNFCRPDPPLQNSFEDFWSLESIGIHEDGTTKDDEVAMAQFLESVVYRDGRYWVKWPWTTPEPNLPSNFGLAFGRLKSLLRKLGGNLELLSRYDSIIQDQLKKGILEEVGFTAKEGSLVHYLPHHPVITPKKLRLVYDASAKAKDHSSLNDCLYRGPIMLPQLVGLLLRFRSHRYIVMADVEAAFLQLQLQEDQRDVTRSLWVKDITKPISDDNLKVLRFQKVLFGVKSSPHLLAATLSHHLQQEHSIMADKLKNNIYVDNVLCTFDTEEEIGDFYHESKELFRRAGMNLRQYFSNSEAFNLCVAAVDKMSPKGLKVLGVGWSPEDDLLRIPGGENIHQFGETKREILHQSASIFDPLGLVSPVTILAKFLLRKLWDSDLNWDAKIKEEMMEEWKFLSADLSQLSYLEIPRLVGSGILGSQLHVFVDASSKAYAATAYLRKQNGDTVSTSLIFAKTRLAPKTKTLTLPRLELMGMTIGSRMIQYLEKELDFAISHKVLWSDSECCLRWLTSKRELSVFVKNRIREITKAIDVTFRYVDTKENPADLPTRGVSAEELRSSDLWWYGPKFLSGNENVWPVKNLQKITPAILEDVQKEEKRNQPLYETSTGVANCAIEIQIPEFPIDLSRFSSHKKLIRVTSIVLRFLKRQIWEKLSKPTQEKHSKLSELFGRVGELGPLEAFEIQSSEAILERNFQHKHYADVFDAIKTGKHHKLRHQLRLFVDPQGRLRCGGRLGNSGLLEDTKFPILLHKNDRYTNLLVERVHKQHFCQGVSYTLAQLRLSHWIPQGRATVKKVIGKCVICRKHGRRTFRLPPIPTLPEARCQVSTPWRFTGVDQAGPLLIKEGETKKKVWIVLFTDLVSRAIHLELAIDLSAESFLACIRRFIARRGRPAHLISDNAPQIIAVQKLLNCVWSEKEEEELFQYLAHEKIQWRFITPLAPWQGGVYERMIGVMKQALKKAVGKRLLTADQMITYLTEVEAVVNSRPLTYVSDDDVILRPIDLMSPGIKLGTPTLSYDLQDPEYKPPLERNIQDRLIQIWKKSQSLGESFWKLWKSEYLLALREKDQLLHKSKGSIVATPKIGSIVLVLEDDVLGPGSWKLAKVNTLIPSQDNQIRSVEVLLPNQKVLKRPVNLICPLEVGEDESPEEVTMTKSDDNKVEGVQTRSMAKKGGGGVNKTHSLLIFPALFSFFLLSHLLIGVSCLSGHGECQRTTRTLPPQSLFVTPNPLKPIRSPECVSNALGIFRDEDSGYLCWSLITCPEGKHLDGRGHCIPPCTCPQWAVGCSLVGSSSISTSTPASVGDQASIIQEAQPEEICQLKSSGSLPSNSHCNRQVTSAKFVVIETYDRLRYPVQALHMEMTETTSEEYSCIGEGTQTGSPQFCKSHLCHSEGTKFCYYEKQDIHYFVSELGKLPIISWGLGEVEYHGFKEVNTGTPRNTTRVECIKGGVQYSLIDSANMVEICSVPHCFSISFPSPGSHQMMLPSEVTMHDHEVRTKVWKNGYLISDISTQCSEFPFCENIVCVFCRQRLTNPQCTSKTEILIILISAYCASAAILLIIKLLKHFCRGIYIGGSCVLRICRCSGSVCRGIWRLARKCRHQAAIRYRKIIPEGSPDSIEFHPLGDSVPIIIGHRGSAPKYKARVLTFVAIVFCLQLTSCCTEVSTIQAKQSSCSIKEGGRVVCSVNQATRVALSPQGQKSCLLIKDPHEKPLGTLSIVVRKIQLKCAKNIEFYSRSFDMKVRGSKRCFKAGSCSGNKCADTTINDVIDELKGESSLYPGFTHCVESCGCASCGCFYCSPGCLFYRTYAKPTTTTVFEVFSCPNWRYQVQLTATLELHGGITKTQQLLLSPGYTTKWQKVAATLISVTKPPTPILGKKFVTDGQRMALVDSSAAGQEVSGTLGGLQCSSREKAEKFQCNLATDTCQCEPRESFAACVCQNVEFEKLFEGENSALPINTGMVQFVNNGSNVHAQYSDSVAIELQLSIRGLEMTSENYLNKCKVTVDRFVGCYSCVVGAKATTTCLTDFGQAISHIRCGKTEFSIPCSVVGNTSVNTLHFNTPNVDEKCNVVCSGGNSEFGLTGNLVFYDTGSIAKTSNIRTGTRAAKGLPSLISWFGGLKLSALSTVGVVAGGVVLFFVTVTCIPCILLTVTKCVTVQARHFGRKQK